MAVKAGRVEVRPGMTGYGMAVQDGSGTVSCVMAWCGEAAVVRSGAQGSGGAW